MIDSYDDLDELERIVRESGWASTTPQTLNDDEQRIAAKLLGREDAKRLARMKSGERFRYRPPRTIRVEFYFRRGVIHDGWAIEGVETTGRRIVAHGLVDNEVAGQIATLRGRGYDCRLVVTEPMKAWGMTTEPQFVPPSQRARGVSFSGRPIAQSRRQPSAARQLLEELGRFKR